MGICATCAISDVEKGEYRTVKNEASIDSRHLATKFFETSGKTSMVVGHRGGFFGPENSLKGFRGAIQNKLEAIEFDIWLSKDNVPMILHGGNTGEMDHYMMPDRRVFQMT